MELFTKDIFVTELHIVRSDFILSDKLLRQIKLSISADGQCHFDTLTISTEKIHVPPRFSIAETDEDINELTAYKAILSPVNFDKVKADLSKKGLIGKNIIETKRFITNPLYWVVHSAKPTSHVRDFCDIYLIPITPKTGISDKYYFCFVCEAGILELYLDQTIDSDLYIVRSDFDLSDKWIRKIKLSISVITTVSHNSLKINTQAMK